jgi:putative Holliday junction resolvase
MLWLGVDYGMARTGLAVGDTDTGLSFPLSVIPTVTLEKLADDIAAVAKREGAGGIVVGMPKRLTGDASATAGTTECAAASLAVLLAERTGLPIEEEDERFSTAMAERSKRDAGGAVRIGADAIAAAVILETFLDRARNKKQ